MNIQPKMSFGFNPYKDLYAGRKMSDEQVGEEILRNAAENISNTAWKMQDGVRKTELNQKVDVLARMYTDTSPEAREFMGSIGKQIRTYA